MKKLSEISRVIEQAVECGLDRALYSRVDTGPAIDPDGLDALEVTIVLRGDAEQVTGREALATIVSIRQALDDCGDERTPLVHFVSEAELMADVDPES